VVVWIDIKGFWLFLPACDDELVWCEALESFEAFSEVIGIQKVVEVALEVFMRLVMVSFDGCVLECSVHPLDLSVSRTSVRLRYLATVFGSHTGTPEPSGSLDYLVVLDAKLLSYGRTRVIPVP
jgi:hypothetical protein